MPHQPFDALVEKLIDAIYPCCLEERVLHCVLPTLVLGHVQGDDMIVMYLELSRTKTDEVFIFRVLGSHEDWIHDMQWNHMPALFRTYRYAQKYHLAAWQPLGTTDIEWHRGQYICLEKSPLFKLRTKKSQYAR